MKAVFHAVVSETPGTIQEIMDVGQAIWLYNIRSHGDEEDIVIYVEGRLTYIKDKLVFLFNSPVGLVQHEMEVDDIHYRLKSYIQIVA